LIGIFEGKKAENNKLILKSLVFGDKTTRQIAEYIYHNRTEKPKPKDNIENEVRGIVSIISRRTKNQKGRIFELEDKGYIRRNSKNSSLWQLTSKGLCVALTQLNTIAEVFPYLTIDLDINGFENAFSTIPIGKAIKTTYPKFNLKKILSLGKKPQLFQLWKDYTNELINMGVDLDRMKDSEFKRLLANKSLEYFFKPELADIERMFRKVENSFSEEGVSHE